MTETSTNNHAIIAILGEFEPAARLSASRLQELAKLVTIEKVSKDINPFRMNVMQAT